MRASLGSMGCDSACRGFRSQPGEATILRASVRRLLRISALGTALLVWGCGHGETPSDGEVKTDASAPDGATRNDSSTDVDGSQVRITEPPASLGLPAFYVKYVDASGVPVVSSAHVPDDALLAARAVVLQMVAGRDDIVAHLQAAHIRVAIMAESEVTTDIPEHADLYEAFPGTDWDERARGLGATFARPASSGAEENVLCHETDRYRGESILVHEFAHTMYVIGIAPHDDGFVGDLNDAFTSATGSGLWSNTYAGTNVDEYWAEGVQDWFDANLSASPSDGVHNEIDTRDELRVYDPALAALVEQVYGDSAYRYTCP